MIRFGQIQNLASSKAFDLLRLLESIGKHPTTHDLMACQSSLLQFKTNCLKTKLSKKKVLKS